MKDWLLNTNSRCDSHLENLYFLFNRYSADAVTNAREKKEGVTEDGIEDAFDLVGEVSLEMFTFIVVQVIQTSTVY